MELTEKTCTKCLDILPVSDFSKNSAKKHGLSMYCKPCMKKYLVEWNKGKEGQAFKKKKPKRRIPKNLRYDDQPESVKKIVLALAENPRITRAELALKTGLAVETVNRYLYSNDFLSAVRAVGAQQVTNMIPKALNTLDKALESSSEEVKLKAATKILENERVLGPNRIEVGINDLSQKPYEELEKIFANMPTPPKPVLDVQEIIS